MAFARKHHAGVPRKYSGKPYYTHPLAVYTILKGVTKDENVLCAALLHDLIEDTDVTYEDLVKEFGKIIAGLVWEVTKDKKGNFPLETKEGLLIKLADMMDNIKDNKSKSYLQKKIKFVKKTAKQRKEEERTEMIDLTALAARD